MLRAIVLLILFHSLSAWAEDAKPVETEKPGFFGLLYRDHVKPSVGDGLDGVGYGILAGGTVLTIWAKQHDGETREAYKGNRKFGKSTSTFGSIWGSGGPGLMIAATQLAFDSANGMAHAESIVLTSLTHASIILLAQRPRPANRKELTSFPSGHSASAWATASSLSYAYGWVVAVPAYTAATLVMLSRVSDDRHWLSDTVAGATIGLFWGRATSFHHQDKSWSFQPLWSSAGLGLEMRHEF